MPITLSSVSRRRFIQGSAVAGAGLLAASPLFGLEPPIDAKLASDPNTFALLADTHISKNPKQNVRGAVMAKNLATVGEELIPRKVRPTHMFINGDCALTRGEADDYTVLLDLLKPIRKVGYDVHLTLGNHDDRTNIWNALGVEDKKKNPVADKHVAIIESPHANWFLLDTLNLVNKTPGKLGEAQLKWLADSLDERKDKPALVVGHHNLEKGNPNTKHALIDTDAMLDVLLSRSQVKAYFFGHSHNWHVTKEKDLHMVNQPPVAYVFDKAKPNGWLNVELEKEGATITLSALNKKHKQHGEKVELKWR